MTEQIYKRTPIEHYYKDEMFVPSWFTFPKLYSYVVDKFPNGSHFVEIGAWKGCSTAYMGVEIHNSGKTIKFDCVDHWLGTVGDAHMKDPDVVGKRLFEKFNENIKRVNQYINPIRMGSVEAAKTYEDGSLDFVFIDADHSYEAVKKDIEAWLPKMKSGGIFAGHDYDDYYHGVIRAVNEKFGDRNHSDPWGESCWFVPL